MLEKLGDYRMPIVAAGFALGLASAFGVLPLPDGNEGLGRGAYMLVIGVAAYTWWTHYHQRALKATALMKKGFHKTPYYSGKPAQRSQPTTKPGPPVPRAAPTRPISELDKVFEK